MSDQTRPNGQARPDEDRSQPDAQAETRRQVTVREAARILNTTVEGVRSRIKRGSLDSLRVEGTVYVLLTPDQANRAHTCAQSGPGEDQALHRLVDEQREMIDWLKREVERKDTILMTLAQRVPELEAAPEPRESPQTPSEQQGNGSTAQPENRGAEKRSWWRRFFGIE